MITIQNPRSLTGLTATVRSAKPAVAWRETCGVSSRTIALTASTAAREIAMLFGASGYSLTGDVDGDFTLTAASPNGLAATGTLTFAANATAGKKVTIGTRVYTFVAALTAAYQVLIGASASASLDNLIAAINGAAGAGTTYGTGTVAHTLGTAAAGAGDTLVFTATAISSSGNSIATTTDVTSASWAAATLTGGITPSAMEGKDAEDITGDDLPTIVSIQAIEVSCLSGSLNLTIGTKVTALPLPTGSVFHYATPAAADPGAVTIAATSADTVATLTIIYK
jgi:hypothetical protein